MKQRPQYILSESDLTLVVKHVRNLFVDLRGQTIFLTGGSGFFGVWLVESFLWINQQLALNASIVVLSRDPVQVYLRFPHLKSHRNLSFVSGDIRNFDFFEGKYAHIVHAAGTPLAAIKENESDHTFETITQGMERILKFAVYSGTKSILFVSSGAVYDLCSADRPIAENDFSETAIPGKLDSYASGKVAAERLGVEWARKYDSTFKIARCFSFLGPCFPLDARFAASMFLKDTLYGKQIKLMGDGLAKRSYLYAADLVISLWTILLKGSSCRPYNVGSSEGISILDFASKISSCAGLGLPVACGPTEAPVSPRPWYVPNVDRAKEELSLVQHVSLDQAIEKTWTWYKERLKIVGKIEP